MRKLSIFLFAFFLFSCAGDNNQIEFIVVSINDVYEIDALEGGRIGGLARVQTLHNQLLDENPNTFLVHGGDFLNPSLLGTMRDENGERYRGKHMIDVMNAMNFDLVAFGNHEFDLTLPDLQKRLNESTFQWIGTNIRLKDDGSLTPFYIEKDGVKSEIPKVVIFDINDRSGTTLKIGFVSATINSNPNIYVDYGDLYTDAINAYKSIENKTDIVLGLTHLSLSQDKLLAKSLPRIPLIIGGHEHTNMLIEVGESLISKADANAKTAYVHRITFDKKEKQVGVKSELVVLDDNIPKDKEITGLISKWNVQLNKKLKEVLENPHKVIFRTTETLDGRDAQIRSKQTNLGHLIAASMSYVFDDKVDGAIINGGSIRIDDELEGNISGVDIFRVLPFGGGITKVKIKGELLNRILEYGKLKSGTGAYLQHYNIEFEKNSKKWKIGGELIDFEKHYTIVLTDYLLLGLDIPFLTSESKGIKEVYENEINHSANDIRKVVINYLKNN